MRGSQTIRYILYCFRATGFYPFVIQTDSSDYLHLKKNIGWYIYTLCVTLIHLINLVDATNPQWELSNFYALRSYVRLILVSVDILVCYVEILSNTHVHIAFFETITKVDAVLKKFKIEVSCKCLCFWVL